MSDLIYPGEIVRITNGDGFERKPETDPPTLFDPASVVLTVRSPSGDVTTPTPSKDSTGVYHADITVDESGRWAYRWSGDSVENESYFDVERSSVTA